MSASEPDSDTAVVKLPRLLDMNAAGPLSHELLGLRGREVQLDASEVERLGAQCLQVLLSARTTWEADRTPFSLAASSAEFDTALALLGADLKPTLAATELTQ